MKKFPLAILHSVTCSEWRYHSSQNGSCCNCWDIKIIPILI